MGEDAEYTADGTSVRCKSKRGRIVYAAATVTEAERIAKLLNDAYNAGYDDGLANNR